MLRKLFDRKGQNTAEYAILIALVVAGIVAMQTYAQRALQARVRSASSMMVNQTDFLRGQGTSYQYEPYYSETSYTVDTRDEETQILDNGIVRQEMNSEVTRNGISTTGYSGEELPQGL